MAKKRGRKGQITVFIIAGIAILIAVAAYFWFREISNEVRPSIIVPPDVIPVKSYIETCLAQSARDGLEIAGRQGGYITIPESILDDKNSYLQKDSLGIVKSPFWHYRGDVRIPDITFIETGMDNYIINTMEECVNNLDAFRDQYTVEILGKPTATTKIGDRGNVYVNYYYPIRISDKAGKKFKTTMTDYAVTLDVNFKDLYDYAVLVLNKENEDAFVEEVTINLMTSDAERIPFTNVNLHCGDKVWMLKDIRQTIMDYVAGNIYRYRFTDTNYLPYEVPEAKYEPFRGVTAEDVSKGNYPKQQKPEDSWDFFQQSKDIGGFGFFNRFKGLVAGLYYDQRYGMSIAARPSDNGELRSGVLKGAPQYLKFMCVNMWHFTYDVSYPIEFVVNDPKAFNGDGYTFTFAFPVMIDHNLPDRFKRESMTFTYDAPSVGKCDEVENSSVLIRAENAAEWVDVVGIEGANISYDCIKYSCDLGQTKSLYGSYMLETALPSACRNGWVIAEKDGYFKGVKQAIYDEGSKSYGDVSVKMVPKHPLKVTVKKYGLYSYQLDGVMNPKPLDEDLQDNEEVMLNVNILVPGEESNLSESTYAVINNKEDTTIELAGADAQYVITAILVNMQNDVQTGGFTMNWTVSGDEIAGAQELVLPILEKVPAPTSRDEDEILAIASYITYNASEYTQFVAPELK